MFNVLWSFSILCRGSGFLYRCNQFTYLVSAVLSIALADSGVTCSGKGLLNFVPQKAKTSGEYMKSYIELSGGYLVDSSSTNLCEFCTTASTNTLLDSIGSVYFLKKSQYWYILCFHPYEFSRNLPFLLVIYSFKAF